jgi:hypothetical protein
LSAPCGHQGEELVGDQFGFEQHVQVPTTRHGDNRPATPGRGRPVLGVRIAEREVGAGSVVPPGWYRHRPLEVRQRDALLLALDALARGPVREEAGDTGLLPPG